MRLLICASEAPLPPLNGARLVVRELSRAMAARHDVCVVAFRWPDQRDEPIGGVELHELQAPLPGCVDRARDRMLSVLRREPVEALRLCDPMARMVTAPARPAAVRSRPRDARSPGRHRAGPRRPARGGGAARCLVPQPRGSPVAGNRRAPGVVAPATADRHPPPGARLPSVRPRRPGHAGRRAGNDASGSNLVHGGDRQRGRHTVLPFRSRPFPATGAVCCSPARCPFRPTRRRPDSWQPRSCRASAGHCRTRGWSSPVADREPTSTPWRASRESACTRTLPICDRTWRRPAYSRVE